MLLFNEMKPSDLKVAPDELFPTERFLSWSLLRNCLKVGTSIVECREFTGCFLFVPWSRYFVPSFLHQSMRNYGGSDANRVSSFALVFSGRSMIW